MAPSTSTQLLSSETPPLPLKVLINTVLYISLFSRMTPAAPQLVKFLSADGTIWCLMSSGPLSSWCQWVQDRSRLFSNLCTSFLRMDTYSTKPFLVKWQKQSLLFIALQSLLYKMRGYTRFHLGRYNSQLLQRDLVQTQHLAVHN